MLDGPDGASLANWQTPPHNRSAFHHVGEFIASAGIANDPAHVSALVRRPRVAGQSLGRHMFLDATATDAMVVLVDGKIAFESYRNGNDAHTPHILMSATKAVVGLLAGLLQHAGELDSDAPVSHYVPEIAQTPYQGATIRHLLDMRTGVALNSVQLRAYQAATNWVPAEPHEAGADLRTWFSQLSGPGARHGGNFRYVSANTDLLGWAIERATGQSVASLLSTRLWKPMGAEHGAFVTVDRQGLARCTGGLCATARDFARVGQLLLDGGVRDSRVVVPGALINDLWTGGDPEAWRKGEWARAFAPIAQNMRYRSGWYVIDDAPGTLFAMGIHGQNLFIDRTNRIVMAKFSSWPKPIDSAALGLTHKAFGILQRGRGTLF